MKIWKSLTLIDSCSWIGGLGVTHFSVLAKVPGSIPGFGKGFMLADYVFLILGVNHINCHTSLQFLLQCTHLDLFALKTWGTF